MLNNVSDAEDVCQDVFITVFRQDWQQIEFIKTWIIRVTVNHCLNHLKRNRSLRMKEQRNQQLYQVTFDKSIDSVIEEREMAKEWSGFLSQLPHKIRAVVSLRYVHDLSLSETSNILQIPIGTVKSRLHKGMKLMRKILDEHGYQEAWEGNVDEGHRGNVIAAFKRG